MRLFFQIAKIHLLFYITKTFAFGKVLSQFSEKFEMEDLVPEILHILNFLLYYFFSFYFFFFWTVDFCIFGQCALNRQPNLCILMVYSFLVATNEGNFSAEKKLNI